MKLFLIFLSLLSAASFAEESKEVILVNQVLFEINKETVTMFDFKNYLKLKKEIKSEQLLSLVQNELQEYVLYQLCDLEVQSLDFQISDDLQLKAASKEQQKFLKIKKFIQFKEKHINQLERYKSWTDILKRKYGYIAKIDELRSN